MKLQDYTHDDTIAAIATPVGEGGVAIIRISGKEASRIIDLVFKPAATQDGGMESHKLCYGAIVDPDTGRVVDRCFCVFMRSPRSYTGEDVAEIHSHGGYILPKKILELVCRYGVRPARPGEFTLRAFLNAKMDLAQAEAVSDVVGAETEESLRLAELQLEGVLSDRIKSFSDAVLDALAEVEAQVDFPEEDIDSIVKDRIVHSISNLIDDISTISATFDEGRIIKHGVSTAIVGKPNVGKSSLLNALLMKERAIVSPYPGTTRDFIEETLSVGGIPLRLVDTAGLRVTGDDVERMGVELAKKKASEAELVIGVIDGSSALDENDLKVFEALNGKNILVINKADLPQVVTASDVERYLPIEHRVSVSAKTGLGIDDLKRTIKETLLGAEKKRDGNEFVITELRHRRALEGARESLERFLEAFERGESPEFLALDLRLALDCLGEITGETTTEDVLGRIFSKFCVGK